MDEKKMAGRGLIHIYCGNGKGKTTAALGLCLRAHGRGKRALWTSFLKDYNSGEFLSDTPFTLYRGVPVTKFCWSMTPEERETAKKEHSERLEALFEIARDEAYDLLVLDEAIGAAEAGLLRTDRLLALLKAKPERLEVVLTGRNPAPELIDAADYVSEMRVIKHPYQQGVGARRGIEN